MSTVSNDLVERYLAPAPALRPAVLRILVGGFAVAALSVELSEYLRLAERDAQRFDPVGPLFFLDSPIGDGAWRAMVFATLALGIAFTLGWRFRVTGPAFALAFLAVTTYRDSWGQVFHVDNLVALHLLILGLTRSADEWSADRRAGRAHRDPPETGYGWPPRLMAIVMIAAYFLAGVAKLRIGGWHWLSGDSLANQVAFDNVRKILVGDVSSPIAGPVLEHLWLFTPMALFALAVELGAPLALLGGRIGRRLRALWAICAWLFHLGILALMAIVFAYPLSGIAFACLFPVERTARRLRDRLPRSPRSEQPGAPGRSRSTTTGATR